MVTRGLRFGVFAAVTVAFMWPALYNRQPFFSPDTSAYVRGFDAAVIWVSGHRSQWTTWAPDLRATKSEMPTTDAAAGELSFQSPNFIIAGRSVLYGSILYASDLLGGLWLAVIFQASLTLLAVVLTLRRFQSPDWREIGLALGVLLGATSLPFFVSFLLPDVFAGLCLLGAANLSCAGDQMSKRERLFWLVTCGLAVVFHPTHLALTATLLGAACFGRLLSRKVSLVGISALGLAVGLGIVAEVGFGPAVQTVTGVPVSRPPVLMARIIADGPGEKYLREKCGISKFQVCDFVDRLVPNSDLFLWDPSPATGVYAASDVTKRQSLANEQLRFAAAVWTYDPGGQFLASLKDTLAQLTLIQLSDFAPAAEQSIERLPWPHVQQLKDSRIRHGSPFVDIVSDVSVLTTLASALLLVLLFFRYSSTVSARLTTFCCMIFAGQLGNALVCGALSGPHERYQARLTWLLPLLAAMVWAEVRRHASRASALQLVPKPSSPLGSSTTQGRFTDGDLSNSTIIPQHVNSDLSRSTSKKKRLFSGELKA